MFARDSSVGSGSLVTSRIASKRAWSIVSAGKRVQLNMVLFFSEDAFNYGLIVLT